MVYFLLAFFIGLIRIEVALSACYLCGQANIACVNQTSFQRCQGSTILPGTTVHCPTGSYCNEDDLLRCVSDNPTCGGMCGICDRSTNIACISKTQYSYCFGALPSNQIGQCGAGEVCYSPDPGICINSALIPVEPTCPDTDTPATTQNPIRTTTSTIPTSSPISEAQKFCLSVGYTGRYSNPYDCKSYFYCYYVGNNINGQKYNCLGWTYFNCQTRKCSYVCKNDCLVRFSRTIDIYNETETTTESDLELI